MNMIAWVHINQKTYKPTLQRVRTDNFYVLLCTDNICFKIKY